MTETPARPSAIRHRTLMACLLLLCFPVAAGSARGATFHIANGDVAGLRNALTAANTNSEDDIIYLPAGGIFTLSDAINGGLSGLIINSPGRLLTIFGNGSTIVRNSSAEFRIFSIRSTAILSGLKIENGKSGEGAGILVESTPAVTLNDCVFSGNVSRLDGGAISSQNGFLTLNRCTLRSNSAGQRGGGIFTNGSCSLVNCTVSWGGIYNTARSAGGSLKLVHCTISQADITNYSVQASDPATMTAGNSIFYQCSLSGGTSGITSQGFNLSSSGAGGFLNHATDRVNLDPGLDPAGPLMNGGLTPTIALLAGSPAIDAGTSAGLPSDQRGQARHNNPAVTNGGGSDGSDIGAYEATDPFQAGAVVVVTTLDDHDDGIAGVADCTLREAAARARVRGAQSIEFAPGLVGTAVLSSALGPVRLESVSLRGPGARVLAISGNNVMRIFDATGGVSISGLTLRDGAVVPAVGNAAGGAILTTGSLQVSDCVFTGNRARGGNGTGVGAAGGKGEGGAIYIGGNGAVRTVVSVVRSTFSANRAAGGNGTANTAPLSFGGAGGEGAGGAVFATDDADLVIQNCTFSNNTMGGGSGGNAPFGGAGGAGKGAVHSAGKLMLRSCTVTANTGNGGLGGTGNSVANNGLSGAGCGGISISSGAATFSNVLCAENSALSTTGIDVFGALTSAGFNLIGRIDGSSGFNKPSDQTGTNAAPRNPLLGPLQNNGGAGDTHLLLAGSPAIDKGTNTGGLPADQRGLPRPLDAANVTNAGGGDGSDIGAVEVDVPQSGAAFVVNSLDDHDDGAASHLDCTLREAIRAANTRGAATTITFGGGLSGIITLQPSLGTLAVNAPVTLAGPGAKFLSISGNSALRIMSVNAGPSFVSGLTFRDGAAAAAAAGEDVQGGGILNRAVLTLGDCVFLGNKATGGSVTVNGVAGGDGRGGGVANTNNGSLTLLRCSFSGCEARGGQGGRSGAVGTAGTSGAGLGGGVFNDTGASLTAQLCTFSNNRAMGEAGRGGYNGGAGGAAAGGAIFSQGNLTALSLTVSGNTAEGGAGGAGNTPDRDGRASSGRGGGMAAGAASFTVGNTICAGNSGNGNGGADVEGAFTSSGWNLIGSVAQSTGFTMPGDQTGTAAAPLNALLGPYQFNGGHTRTMAPLPGSPALDRGRGFGLATDQRRLGRLYDYPALANAPGGDAADIGALEVRPVYSGPPFILSVESRGTAVHILLQGEPSRLFQLQYNSDPASAYFNLGSVESSDGAGQIEYIDAGPLPEKRFYRALQLP